MRGIQTCPNHFFLSQRGINNSNPCLDLITSTSVGLYDCIGPAAVTSQALKSM